MHPTAAPFPPTPPDRWPDAGVPRGRRARSRALRRAAAACAATFVVAAAALAATATGDDGGGDPQPVARVATAATPPDAPPTTSGPSATTSEARPTRQSPSRRVPVDGLRPAPTTPPTTIGLTGPPPASGGAPAGTPVLVVADEHTLDPNVGQVAIVIGNAGDAPLTWQAATEPGDTLDPASGSVAPGDEQVAVLTLDPYASGTKHWTHLLALTSDGGDAEVEVHGTTLLPGMFVVTGGTYQWAHTGVYRFPDGDLDGGINVKNEGDLPLDLTFTLGGGITQPGGPDLHLEPGATAHVHWVACGVPAVPANVAWIIHDVSLTISSPDWPEPIERTLRFFILGGQDTGPCPA